MTRLSNDVNLARTSSTDLLLSLISNCILFISNCCSLLLVVDREMTFVFLLVLPIYMYITILFSKNAKYLAKKYNKILA
jgi:ABC-type multidrug transport system fused ATPase/permease subunit